MAIIAYKWNFSFHLRHISPWIAGFTFSALNPIFWFVLRFCFEGCTFENGFSFKTTRKIKTHKISKILAN
jgi:hypothetical protein